MGESPTNLAALDAGMLRKLLGSALREEIRRLKGIKGKPKLKPSGMEKETTKRAAAKDGKKRRRRGSKITNLKIDAEEIVSVQPPEGSRFKGYERCVVQDDRPRPRPQRPRRRSDDLPGRH